MDMRLIQWYFTRILIIGCLGLSLTLAGVDAQPTEPTATPPSPLSDPLTRLLTPTPTQTPTSTASVTPPAAEATEPVAQVTAEATPDVAAAATAAATAPVTASTTEEAVAASSAPISVGAAEPRIRQRDDGRWVVPLTVLGYGDVIRLSGQVAQRALFLDLPAGLTPVELTMQVKTSPDVNSGFVEVRNSDNRVLETLLLPPDTAEATFTVPLERAPVVDDLLSLTLAGRLRSEDDICETALIGAWLDLEDSFLLLEGEPTVPETVATFFPSLLTDLHVYVPSEPTLAEAEATLTLTAAATRRYAAQDVRIHLHELADRQTLPASTPGAITTRSLVVRESARSEVRLTTDDQAYPLLLLDGDTDELRRQAGLLAAPLSAFAVVPATRVLTFDLPQQIGGELFTLDALGFNNAQITGVGRMEINFNVTQADLGGRVEAIAVRMAGTYTPPPPEANASFSLLLNGTLIAARQLDNSGEFDVFVDAPQGLLQRDNIVTARFDYTPTEGLCRVGIEPFTAQIDSSSYLQVTRGPGSLHGFDRFPQNMLEKFIVAAQPLDYPMLASLTALVNALQQITDEPLTPQVTDWAAAVESDATLVLASSSLSDLEPLNPPLLPDPVRIVGADGADLLELDASVDFAALVAFQHNQRDVLLLTYRGDPQQVQTLTTGLVNDTLGWYGLGGDVYLRSGNQPPVNVQVRGTETATVEPLVASVDVWRARLQPFIYAGVVVLLILVLIWAYPRVVRRTAKE